MTWTDSKLSTLVLLGFLALSACGGDELAPGEDAGPVRCAIDCDCPQGNACIDGTCTATATPIYCCDTGGCPAGDRCVTRAGMLGVCPECNVDCDCPQGQACSASGLCVATAEPTYCCDTAGCPSGLPCSDFAGTAGTCAAECESSCDCAQGEACTGSGLCVATAEPTYCCDNAGCPLGEACEDAAGEAGRCAECQGPCDCPQGQACSASGLCVATAEPTYCCDNAGCPSGAACVGDDGSSGTCRGAMMSMDAGTSTRDAGVPRDAGFDAGFDAGRPPTDAGAPTACSVADVLILQDSTGSMGDEIRELRTNFTTTIAPGLAAAVGDIRFAVARFDDFPVSPVGGDGDVPFALLQAVTPSVSSAQSAIDRLTAAGGVDAAEAQVEALYQVGTGEGIGAWVAARSCTSGVGYPCFRASATPIVVLITDAPFHNSPNGGADEDYAGITPTPHTYAQALAALQRIGAVVLGIHTGASGLDDLRRVVADTGGVDASGPLVIELPDTGAGLPTAVVSAVQRYCAAASL